MAPPGTSRSEVMPTAWPALETLMVLGSSDSAEFEVDAHDMSVWRKRQLQLKRLCVSYALLYHFEYMNEATEGWEVVEDLTPEELSLPAGASPTTTMDLAKARIDPAHAWLAA